MKYIVLHREGTEWKNKVGNSLHVPFIDAANEQEAVERAITLAGRTAPMYLVCCDEGWFVIKALTGWKVDLWNEEF